MGESRVYRRVLEAPGVAAKPKPLVPAFARSAPAAATDMADGTAAEEAETEEAAPEAAIIATPAMFAGRGGGGGGGVVMAAAGAKAVAITTPTEPKPAPAPPAAAAAAANGAGRIRNGSGGRGGSGGSGGSGRNNEPWPPDPLWRRLGKPGGASASGAGALRTTKPGTCACAGTGCVFPNTCTGVGVSVGVGV